MLHYPKKTPTMADFASEIWWSTFLTYFIIQSFEALDQPPEYDYNSRTLLREGLICPSLSLGDIAFQAFGFRLYMPIINNITENKSVTR